MVNRVADAGVLHDPGGGVEDTTTCADGFPGPGTPACLLPISGVDTCVILCETPGAAGQCPDGLACIYVPSDLLNVCVQP